MNKTLTTILAIISTLQAYSQNNTVALSLNQATQLGIERNVNVKNAELETQKSRFQLKEAQSKLYPQIEGYSTLSYYFAIPKMIVPGEIFGQTGLIPIEIGTKFDWSNGFKATQLLYNQSYFTSIKLAREMENLTRLSLEKQKEEIVLQVSQIYYLCQNTSKQIELLTRTLTNTDHLLEITKLQSQNGVIRKVDHSRVQVNKSNLQTQIDNLQQLYHQQLGLLKYLIGIEQKTNVELSDSISCDIYITPEDSVDFQKRFEIQLLENRIKITDLTRKSVNASNIPTLTGFGQYYFQGQRNQFDYFKSGENKFYKVGVVGISLSVPIFDGLARRSKTKQYDIEVTQLQNTRKSTMDYFSKEYTDAVKQYNNSYNALVRQGQNIKVAEETYNISLDGYRQQVLSLSDLLLSESSLTEARLSYYNAVMQFNYAELELRKAKGELLKF